MTDAFRWPRKKKKNEVCIRGHKQIPENMYMEPSGVKKCKLCDADRKRIAKLARDREKFN